MEHIRGFLESSTIHGLTYISSTKKFVKVCWTLIVIGGFTGAGVLIYQSFDNWAESPVTTTIETQPIFKITFPKITVCPPKNTYTDLNYAILLTESITLDNETRNKLTNYAVELLNDINYNMVMSDMHTLQDQDRFLNWYRGYLKVNIRPNYQTINIYDVSGSISTEHFGDKFNPDHFTNFFISTKIKIWPPKSVLHNTNVTLHMDLDKVKITDYADRDTYSIDNKEVSVEKIKKSFSPPSSSSSSSSSYSSTTTTTTESSPWGSVFNTGGSSSTTTQPNYHFMFLARGVNLSPDDVKNLNQDMMPGFNLTWYYSGMNVAPDDPHYETDLNKLFVRYE